MLVGATSERTLFDLPDAFYALMTVSLGGLPLAVWLAALAFAVAGFMLWCESCNPFRDDGIFRPGGSPASLTDRST
jgi:hypothetical protein